MKHILVSLCLGLLLFGMSSCDNAAPQASEGKDYFVSLTFDVDSTVVLDHLLLYTDSHVAVSTDSLILSPEKTVNHQGFTLGLDELYLCTDGGELCRFFAQEGSAVNVTLRNDSTGLRVDFANSEHDSINPWLKDQVARFAGWTATERHAVMDSLCHQMPGDVRCALLLREEASALSDSVFVRRCLGALTAEAKPEWLIKSIEDLLAATSDYRTRNSRRLAVGTFQVNDTTEFDTSKQRSEYLLIYCWADYDQASVDSLKNLVQLVSDDFDYKRLSLLSCCLNAPDSAWWAKKVEGQEGMHVLLPAGLADKRIRNMNVDCVPTLILCDMYCNQLKRNVWGKELREALDRVPNRSGFAHTPKKKKNGR